VPGRPDDREFIMSKEKQENDHPAALVMIEELPALSKDLHA
jgi:hypothetical protein